MSRWKSSILLAAAAMVSVSAPAIANPLTATGRWSAYDRGSAEVPPMGWSSWNAFYTDITEEKLLASAQVILDSGLAEKGYRYINIDDGWWLKRKAGGEMVIRTANFPSAAARDGKTSFRPLTDRLHAMGLKAGIYSDIGRNSCGQIFTSDMPNQPEGSMAEREVGLYGHVDQDIALYFADWGFDLIKVDACGIRGLGPDSPGVKSGKFRAFDPLIDVQSIGRTHIAEVRGLYAQVEKAIERNNPDNDFIYSICLWGSADVRSWGKDMGSISRTSEDISPGWSRLLVNFDSVSHRALYAHPRSWNDADMLFIGSGDFDEKHLTEARSHFSLWAIMNSPLFIGYDLRKASPALMAIWGNTDVIALNQDPAGHQAIPAYDSDDVQIFVKTLANGTKGVAIFNRGLAVTDATLTADHLKFASTAPIELVDLWDKKAMRFEDGIKLHLEPRQTLVFTAAGKRRLVDGLYLSEQPGNVNPAVDGVVTPEPDPMIHRAVLGWKGTKGSGERPQYGGWGGAQADSTPYGQTLQINGRQFDTGIGILSNSRLEVRNKGYGRFSALVGVDDSATDANRTVAFEIYGDGKLLARSRPLKRGQPAEEISATIAQAQIVELVARSSGPAASIPVPVTWAEAAMLH